MIGIPQLDAAVSVFRGRGDILPRNDAAVALQERVFRNSVRRQQDVRLFIGSLARRRTSFAQLHRGTSRHKDVGFEFYVGIWKIRIIGEDVECGVAITEADRAHLLLYHRGTLLLLLKTYSTMLLRLRPTAVRNLERV